MFLYIFKIIIKLIMTSSRFDPGSTSVRPQNPWTSPFYGSMNGPGLKTLMTTSCHVISLRQCPTSAHVIRWPLILNIDRWLGIDFLPKSQKFSIGPILLSFSRRFRFWTLFLRLRSLNPSFLSFSSLWLNKTNETLYVLSPLSWMVLLAIMHGLKTWLFFSRVTNYGGM